jgi:hypothetical protein
MTLHEDTERFDLISNQLESFKKVILNMVILMKNLRCKSNNYEYSSYKNFIY